MSRFPDDHPVEAVRDRRRPTRTEILRELAGRIAWLQERIGSRVRLGQPHQHESLEILALTAAAEIVEAAVDVGEDVGDVLADLLAERADGRAEVA